MSARPWMAFYFADFISETAHLSAEEVGAYVLLKAHYWVNGGLPRDAERLARISHLDPQKWECESSVLSGFFGPDWTHKRLDEERAKSDVISAKRTDAAHKSWGNKTNRGHANAARKHRQKQSRTNDSHNHINIHYDPTLVGDDEPCKRRRGSRSGGCPRKLFESLRSRGAAIEGGRGRVAARATGSRRRRKTSRMGGYSAQLCAAYNRLPKTHGEFFPGLSFDKQSGEQSIQGRAAENGLAPGVREARRPKARASRRRC
jgi:uncharacterized protein YdaU (DUF1376 family)